MNLLNIYVHLLVLIHKFKYCAIHLFRMSAVQKMRTPIDRYQSRILGLREKLDLFGGIRRGENNIIGSLEELV